MSSIDLIAKEPQSHNSLLAYIRLTLRGLGVVWYCEIHFHHTMRLLAIFCADRRILLEPGIRTWKEATKWKLGATGKCYHYPLHSCWDGRLDKLINLSCSYLSTSAAVFSLPFKEVSSDIGIDLATHPQNEATLGFQDTEQEIWRSNPLRSLNSASHDSRSLECLMMLRGTEHRIPNACVCHTRGSPRQGAGCCSAWLSSLHQRDACQGVREVGIAGTGCPHEDFTYKRFSLWKCLVLIKSHQIVPREKGRLQGSLWICDQAEDGNWEEVKWNAREGDIGKRE